MRTHRVVLVGLGATGRAIGRSLVGRSDCRIVGAADISPTRKGANLGDVLGRDGLDVTVVSDVKDLPEADIAVVATTSFLDAIEPTLTALVQRGLNVVSICEQLGYPYESHPEVASRLDKSRSITVSRCSALVATQA
jgi:2,4-diaminopentanoate dehydrogenase